MISTVRLCYVFVMTILLIKVASTSPSERLRSSHYGSSLIAQQQSTELSRELELANKLIHRLMDVAYETAKDFGAKESDLKNVLQKRNIITACYFQAITCY